MNTFELKEVLFPFHTEIKQVDMPVGHDPFFTSVERGYILQQESFQNIDAIIRKFSNCNIVIKDCADLLNESGEVAKYRVRYCISGPNTRIAGSY